MKKSTLSTQMVLPVKYSASTSATLAEEILEDELECDTCNKCINDDRESVKCDNCGNTCHKMCTNMSDNYTLCMVCCATQENSKQRQSAGTSDVHSTSTIDLTVDKSDSSSSKSNTGSVNSVSNKETGSVCVISDDKQLSGQPAMKTKAPSNQPAAEGKVQTNIKMQDVRTREEKLRKREEELKQREAAIRETENRQIHLEGTCSQVLRSTSVDS